MIEEQKKSILLYLDMLPMLESLSPAACGKVILALLHYARDGTVPKGFRGAAKVALEFIRAQIDRDTEKYRKRCETNRKNALCRTHPKAASAGSGSIRNAMAADTDTETETEKETETETHTDTDIDTDTEQTETFERYRQVFLRECPTLPEPEEAKNWTTRQKHLLRQLNISPEKFACVCRQVEESDFLTGRNGKWNGCTFDWLLQKENLRKVEKGFYGSTPVTSATPKPSFDLDLYDS